MINLVIDWKQIEIEFMDESITAEIRPLNPEHMLLLLPYLKEQNAEIIDLIGKRKQNTIDKEEEQRLSDLMLENSKNNLQLQKAAAPIYPAVIRNIQGIQLNGMDINPSILGTEAGLCLLATSLLTQVFIHTNLSKESEKNSQSPLVVKPPPPAGRVVDH